MPYVPQQEQRDAMDKVVELIRVKGQMRTGEIAEHLGRSRNATLRLINKLYEAGRIAGVGLEWKLK